MLFKSANVCESASWYVKLSIYGATLKVVLFLLLKARNLVEITVKAFCLTKAMRN